MGFTVYDLPQGCELLSVSESGLKPGTEYCFFNSVWWQTSLSSVSQIWGNIFPATLSWLIDSCLAVHAVAVSQAPSILFCEPFKGLLHLAQLSYPIRVISWLSRKCILHLVLMYQIKWENGKCSWVKKVVPFRQYWKESYRCDKSMSSNDLYCS